MKNFTQKMFLVFCGALVAMSLQAQIVDQLINIGSQTGHKILYANVTLNDNDSVPGKINSAVCLIKDSFPVGVKQSSWNIAYCVIRTSNINNTQEGYNNVIDSYNGSYKTGTTTTTGYQTIAAAPADTQHFVVGNTYHYWFDFDVAAGTYTSYVQTPTATTPYKLLDGVFMRNYSTAAPAPAALNYLAAIHNTATETKSKITINKWAFVNSVAIPAAVQNVSNKEFSYTNPVSGVMQLNSNQNITKVEIYTIEGQKLISVRPSGNTVNMSSLSNGAYIMRVQFANGSISNGKVVKQ
jgi:hypothetical protein